MSIVLEKSWELCGVEHQTAAPFSPETTGLVARFSGTLSAYERGSLAGAMDLESVSAFMKGLESVSELMNGVELISAHMEALDLRLEPKDLFNGTIKVFEEFMDLFQDKGQADVASITQAELDSFKSTMLNIAVTGETGAGKSSFINALRGLTAEDDGAAPTGVTETTKQPTVYPHPNHPNVRLWDLPGIRGPDFHPHTYLRKVNFKTYDFFVIVASERFKFSHAALAQEIGRMGKRFYFVRSKVDEDLRNEERDRPRTFRREMVLQRLQADCRENLQRAGMSHPEIFLL
uniref:IRG-type G domain-containing protein n=1 Tax=Pelodiscus sinensis TaxID=13735 RepID=K7FNE7_PELSI